MKQMCSVLIAVLVLASAGLSFAQSTVPIPVQQSASRLDQATYVGTSKTSAATITLTVDAGKLVVLDAIDISNCAGASAVTAAAPTDITTTGLNGVTWTIGSGVTAGLCQPFTPFIPATGLRGTANTATVVLPTFATNQTVRVNVYYHGAVAPQ